MSFKRGDTVRFLNETGGGVITGFTDNNTALVHIDEGFEIPMPVSELVNTASVPDTKDTTEPAITNTTKEKTNYSEEVFLAVIPKEKVFASEFEMYLINTTPFHILYSLYIQEQSSHGKASGISDPDTEKLLCTISAKELEQSESIYMQAVFHKEETAVIPPPLHTNIAVKSTLLKRIDLFKKIPRLGKTGLLFALLPNEKTHKSPDHTLLAKEGKKLSPRKTHPIKSQSAIARSELEINLHIEELTNNHNNMSGSEMLRLQLRHFRHHLENAITANIHKIIFIHGVGGSILKQEILRILKEDYEDMKYRDAPLSRYGYGATEVIIY